MVRDLFCIMATALPLDAAARFESMEEDEDHTYQNLFWDHHEGEGVVIRDLSC